MYPDDSHSGQDPRRLKGVDCYCRECHYPLTGLRSPGTCPECGCDFDFTRLLSYTFEPQPRNLIERVILCRPTAIGAATGLATVLLVLTTSDGALAQHSHVGLLVFAIIFVLVWLISFATTPNMTGEGLWHFVIVGSLVGTLAFVPIAFNSGWSRLLAGYFFGVVCGLVVYHVKESVR